MILRPYRAFDPLIMVVRLRSEPTSIPWQRNLFLCIRATRAGPADYITIVPLPIIDSLQAPTKRARARRPILVAGYRAASFMNHRTLHGTSCGGGQDPSRS